MPKNKILVLLGVLTLFFCYNTDVLAYYKSEENMTQEVRAEHILVKTEDEAKYLKTKIQNGASFEEIAREYSECPSGKQGGDLGYFTRGQMVKPFEDAAFDAKVGEITDPVQTQFGWHLIKIIDKK